MNSRSVRQFHEKHLAATGKSSGNVSKYSYCAAIIFGIIFVAYLAYFQSSTTVVEETPLQTLKGVEFPSGQQHPQIQQQQKQQQQQQQQQQKLHQDNIEGETSLRSSNSMENKKEPSSFEKKTLEIEDNVDTLIENDSSEIKLPLDTPESDVYDWKTVKVPRILHQTAKSYSSLNELKKSFFDECDEYYSEENGWKHVLWEDEQITGFVKKYFPQYFERFNEMAPWIRQVDTVRYFWMYKYGGVYLDLDGECLRTATKFFDGLPPGSTAWVGGFPEPFFLASTPGNAFWLYAVEDILSNWQKFNVRSSSGPQGLHRMMKGFVNQDGGPDRVRLFAMHDESEAKRIMPEGDVKVGEETWRWYVGHDQLVQPTGVDYDHKIGFIPNQIVDPTACLATIRNCRHAHCHPREDISNSGALFVHHCHESWGGEGKAKQQQSQALRKKNKH